MEKFETSDEFPWVLIDTANNGINDRYATREEAEADKTVGERVEWSPRENLS